jgi:hypothetical protein
MAVSKAHAIPEHALQRRLPQAWVWYVFRTETGADGSLSHNSVKRGSDPAVDGAYFYFTLRTYMINLMPGRNAYIENLGALNQHRSTWAMKKSVWEDFKDALDCS